MAKKLTLWGLTGLAALVLVGCSQAGQAKPDNVSAASNYIVCPSERPKICTREYRPVCAETLVYCVQAPCPAVKETFANACEACANDGVNGYIAGACDQQKPIKSNIMEQDSAR